MAVEKVTVDVGDVPIEFETGKLAKQANGAVVVRSGDTMVLVTAVGAQEARPGADFFPLTVDVEERMYAAGKIPGGFIKRESRPSDRATLTARMTDRPVRPLWPKGYRNETQVVATVLSVDHVNAFDILCINGASAALMLSELPFQGPVGAVRIGLIGDEFVINPTLQESEESDLDLVVAGTEEAISMVEAGAKEVDEETMLEALGIAHDEIRRICAVQTELRERPGKPKWEVDAVAASTRSCSRRSRRPPARTSPRPPASRPSWPAATRSPPSAPPPPRRSSATTRTPRRPPPSPPRSTRWRSGSSASASPWTRSARTAARPTRSGRSAARCGCSRASTARASSPAARPRCSRASRSAPRRRRSASTASASRPRSATSTTTTSRPSAWARPASCAAPSAATSATARSPSGPSCR